MLAGSETDRSPKGAGPHACILESAPFPPPVGGCPGQCGRSSSTPGPHALGASGTSKLWPSKPSPGIAYAPGAQGRVELFSLCARHGPRPCSGRVPGARRIRCSLPRRQRLARPKRATSQASPHPPPSLPRVPGCHPVGCPGARPGLPRRGGSLWGVLTSAFDPALAHANDCQHQTGCEGEENYPLKRDGPIPIISQGIADLRIFHYPKCCAFHTKQPRLRHSRGPRWPWALSWPLPEPGAGAGAATGRERSARL